MISADNYNQEEEKSEENWDSISYNFEPFMKISTNMLKLTKPQFEKGDVYQLLQGSANPQTSGSENKRIKICVLLAAAGRRTQLFHLIFSEPGVCGFAGPCTFLVFLYVFVAITL